MSKILVIDNDRSMVNKIAKALSIDHEVYTETDQAVEDICFNIDREIVHEYKNSYVPFVSKSKPKINSKYNPHQGKKECTRRLK